VEIGRGLFNGTPRGCGPLFPEKKFPWGFSLLIIMTNFLNAIFMPDWKEMARKGEPRDRHSVAGIMCPWSQKNFIE
jgi:hypothetical protein